jgi:hypothetical protein
MLDVIKDTRFDGFRFTGWPAALEKYNTPAPLPEKELSRRGLRMAILSFGGPADEPSQHDRIRESAHNACRFLQRFGAN